MPGMMIVAATSGATVSDILPEITAIVTAAIGWVGSVVTAVKAEPLLLVGCVIPFVGLGIGLFKRLLRV